MYIRKSPIFYENIWIRLILGYIEKWVECQYFRLKLFRLKAEVKTKNRGRTLKYQLKGIYGFSVVIW